MLTKSVRGVGGPRVVKRGQTHRRFAAGEARHGGKLRILSSVDQIGSGEALRASREAPHPVVQVAGRG